MPAGKGGGALPGMSRGALPGIAGRLALQPLSGLIVPKLGSPKDKCEPAQSPTGGKGAGTQAGESL